MYNETSACFTASPVTTERYGKYNMFILLSPVGSAYLMPPKENYYISSQGRGISRQATFPLTRRVHCSLPLKHTHWEMQEQEGPSSLFFFFFLSLRAGMTVVRSGTRDLSLALLVVLGAEGTTESMGRA